jgi:succinate dehydrogenase/fumarate reductase flavoprotein subunit
MNFNIGLSPPGYVLVDKYGHRFANEDAQAMSKEHFYLELLAYDIEKMEYPRIPAYWIFDRRRMEAGHLVAKDIGLVGSGLYDWSADNRRELARGWISEGPTVEDMARRAGIADPAACARTIEAYNQSCETEQDPYGRGAASLLPLEPPYYCMPVYPGGASTCGGPKRDARARILDANDVPIAGLFGAGELGEAVGLLYPSGGANLSDGLCFGQIAAESALAAG